jgi:hypothetical protein
MCSVHHIYPTFTTRPLAQCSGHSSLFFRTRLQGRCSAFYRTSRITGFANHASARGNLGSEVCVVHVLSSTPPPIEATVCRINCSKSPSNLVICRIEPWLAFLTVSTRVKVVISVDVPPPPYHLFDVTKQFSFNYATAVERGTASKDVYVRSSEQCSAPPADDSSDTFVHASSTADSEAATLALQSLRCPITDDDIALSVFSSEDGGVFLPPPSTSSSTASTSTTQMLKAKIGPLNLGVARELLNSSPTYQLPAINELGRSSTASVPTARARIEENLIARAQSAATDHQQYALYRRQYDRNRNTLGTPSLSITSYLELDVARLTYRDFEKCSEPWALSSVSSWLKDVLVTSLPGLTETTYLETLERLFHYKLSFVNTTMYPSSISRRVLKAMISTGALIPSIPGGHIFEFGSGIATGVLVELTGGGCYTPTVHGLGEPCYSPRCISNDHLEKPANALGLEPSTPSRGVARQTGNRKGAK